MSFGFDLTNIEPEESRGGCLPAGTYTATIEKADKKESVNKATSKYLSIQYKVCDMESRNGAVFFDSVNIHNESEQAQEIGRKRLKSMLVACGASEAELKTVGPEFLIGKKVDCIIGIEKREGYSDRNKVFQVLKSEKATEAKTVSNSAPTGWV